MRKKEGTREQVGTVYVDAGLVWVGDPCYVMGDDASNRVHDWIEGFCNKLGDDEVHQPLGKGIGLAIQSGFGDGEYPVYVEYGVEGRPSKVTIDFLLDTEDEDEDEGWGEPECERCGSADWDVQWRGDAGAVLCDDCNDENKED